MDITPSLPAGSQVIEAYGGGGFRIAGRVWAGSVLVFADRTRAWPGGDIAALTPESLVAVERAAEVEILLIGCGPEMALIEPALRARFKAAGVVIDAMDTGAACRTFNVLLSEARPVAAALIAVE